MCAAVGTIENWLLATGCYAHLQASSSSRLLWPILLSVLDWWTNPTMMGVANSSGPLQGIHTLTHSSNYSFLLHQKKNTFLVTWADQWHDCVSDDVLYHLVCAGNLLEKLKAPCMQLIRWQVLVSQAKDYSYASSILVYVIVCYNLVLLITPWIIVFIWSLAALLGSKRNYHVLEYIA